MELGYGYGKHCEFKDIHYMIEITCKYNLQFTKLGHTFSVINLFVCHKMWTV